MTKDRETRQVLFKDRATRKSYTLQVSCTSTVSDLQTRLCKMMASGAGTTSMSLVYEGKTLPKTANCGLIKPLSTVVIECATLPGGALNDSNLDDSFVKAQSMDSVPLLTNRRSVMSSSIVDDAAEAPLEEITLEDLIECHFSSLKERLDEELKDGEMAEGEVDKMHEELKEWHKSILGLAEDRQKLVAKVLVAKLADGLGDEYNEKGNYWLDYINSDPQERLLFRLRSREFNMQQILLVMKGDITEAMASVNLLQEEDQWHFEFAEGMSSHPQDLLESAIQKDWTGHLSHLSTQERDNTTYFRSELGEAPEHDLSIIIKKFGLKNVLDLMLSVTPSIYRDRFLAKDACSAHKFMLELVESATSEKLFGVLLKAAKAADGEIADSSNPELYEKFIGCLMAEFKTKTEEEEFELLLATKNMTLQSIFLKQLSPSQVKKILDKRQKSVKQSIELLNKCGDEQRVQVLSLYSKQDQEKFQAYQVLYLTGHPHKTIGKTIADAKEDFNVINTATYMTMQALPWPGKPNKFIVLGKQLGAKFFQTGDLHEGKGEWKDKAEQITKEVEEREKQDKQKIAKLTNVSFETFQLFDQDKLTERVKEEDIGMSETNKKAFINNICPKIPYHSQMRKKIGKDEPDTSWSISVYEAKSDESFSLVNFFNIDEPCQWLAMGNYLKDSIKQQFLFSGYEGDVFWFEKKLTDDGSDKIELNWIKGDSESPEKVEIKQDSPLTRLMLKGAEDRTKYQEDDGGCKYRVFPLAVPTIFRDTPDTPIVTYSDFRYEVGRPEVFFYDINLNKDIGKATSANWFNGFIESEGKMVLQRDLLVSAQPPVHEYAGLDSIMNDIAMSCMLAMKGYPTLYVADVDFAAMRMSGELVELIEDDSDNCAELQKIYEQSSLEEALARNDEEGTRWITCKNDDPMVNTYPMQSGATIRRPIKTDKLLAWHTIVFDPDGDTNMDTFYELDSLTSASKHFTNEPHHCFAVTNEQTDQQLVMMLNPKSGGLIYADLREPKTQLFTSDWPKNFKETDKSWYQPLTLHDGHIYRLTINGFGQLKASVAKLPKDLNDPSLKTKDFDLDDSKMPILIDYPLLCSIRGVNSISVDNMSSLEQQKQIFHFNEVEIIMFLEDNQASSDCRVNLLARDKETGRICVIKLRNEQPFEPTKPQDLNNWRAEKFILHESFSELLVDAPYVKQAFILDTEDEMCSRQSIMQPAILLVLHDRINLAMKGSYEVVLKSTTKSQLSPIPVIRGPNDQFFCVQQEEMSKTSHIVEIKMSNTNFKYSAMKKQVFSLPSTAILSLQIDPKSLTESDYYWTRENKKERYAARMVQFFLLEEHLNVMKIQQEKEGKYEKIWTKNMSGFQYFGEIVQSLPAGHSVVISDRTITVNGECYVFETNKELDIFFKAMEGWDVVEVQRARGTDKVIAKMRNKTTGQFRYVAKKDVATRSLDLFGIKIKRDVQDICWISREKLLARITKERRTVIEPEEGEEGEKTINLNSYWTIIDVQGKTHEIPTPLRDVLQKQEWEHAIQGVDLTGQREIILSTKRSVGHVKLAGDGSVAGFEFFDFNEDLEAEGDELTSQVMSDQEGNIYRISIKQKGELTEVPKFKKRLVKGGTQLIFFEFEKGSQGTEFTVCGDYLCWRPADSLLVHSCYMQVIEEKKSDQDLSNLKQFIKTMDFSAHHKDQLAYRVSLNTLTLQHAIQAYPSREVTMDLIRDSRNHLQVTFGNRSAIYKLEGTEPTSSPELNAIDKFCDPQRYTENGIKVVHNDEYQTEETEESYGLSTMIQARPQGEYYAVLQRGLYPSKYFDNDKIKEDERVSPFHGIFRSYSEQALLEIERLLEIKKNGLTPKTMDPQILLANFDGSTAFSIFAGWNKLMELIPRKIELMALEDEQDEDETEIENTFLRSLNRVLNQKVYIDYQDERDEDDQVRHIVRSKTAISTTLDLPSERDALLKIGRLTKDFSIFDDVWDQEVFQKLIERGTPQLIEELNNCFRESKSTSMTTHIAWPSELEKITYRSKNFVFDVNELKVHLEEEGEETALARPIKVRMFKIDWMMRDGKNFIVLTPLLGECSDEFYQSKFMENLLEQFWSTTQSQIFYRQFLPFLTYMILSITFMFYGLQPQEEIDPTADGSEIRPMVLTLAVLVAALWAYSVRNEVKQFTNMDEKLSYFTSFWNVVDLTQIIFNMIIIISVVTSMFGLEGLISFEVLRVMGAFASCCQMIKCYDWLRMFDDTSFFILLIGETLKDIVPFMILLSVTLLTFGVPMVLLNLNRGDENAVIEPIFGFWVLDLLMNQYLLALGEFNMDSFAENPQSAICYVFFILATFITQLTMLNMLIAIMGDTFGRVMEKKEIKGIQTKLDLMSDLAGIIGNTKAANEGDGDYLFIVEPDDEEGGDGEDWEGAVNKMNRFNEKRNEDLKELINKEINNLKEQSKADVERDVTQNVELRKQIYEMIQGSLQNTEQTILDKLEKAVRDIKENQ